MSDKDLKPINQEESPPAPIEFDAIGFRMTNLTDRDAPSLYAPVGPRDLFTLWEEKVEIEDSTPADCLGLFESRALLLFQEGVENMDLRVRCFAKSAVIPFLVAIIDAASFEKKIVVRVVAQSAEDFAKVESLHLPTRAGRVPEQHWIEIQHQLAVLGFEEAYFVSTIDGTQIKIATVKADPVFRSNHIAECILFWDYVRRCEVPPNAVAPDDSLDPNAEAKATTFVQPELGLTGEEEHA